MTDALRLTVYVTPRSSCDQVGDISQKENGHFFLKVRTRTRPEKGHANQTVVKILAKFLSLPPSYIRLIHGASSRIKIFLVTEDTAKLRDFLSRHIP